MKKTLSILLALTLALSLAACSSAPDVTELTENYNAVAVAFNEVAPYIAESPDAAAYPEIIDMFNFFSAEITSYSDAIKNPGDYTQEDIDAMNEKCIEAYGVVEQVAEIVNVDITD